MTDGELTGAELDAAVAKAEGVTGLIEKDGRMCHEQEWDPEGMAWRDDMRAWKMWIDYAPSQRWDQGGPIIEREGIELHCMDRNGRRMQFWTARHPEKPLPLVFGETALAAAMRAYVASKSSLPSPSKC
jgi:hypothetical protein